jgi:ribosomal protein S18 acetylase RimI-like enzyme
MIDPVLIEQLADNAWPAAEQVPLGPWKLRATHGVTRRANSVFTAAQEDVRASELEELIDQAERFYSLRSLPPVFQISAATGAKNLDALLERRGYRINAPSEIWTRSTTATPCSNQRMTPDCTVRWEGQPGDDWFDCAFDEPVERRRVHEQIVRRVPPPRVYVAAMRGQEIAGCGMATSAKGHTGIFCMATKLQHRRRGIARLLLRQLCDWSRNQGDQHVFLQVMSDNQPGKALYERAGFKFEYDYHYRIK